MKIEEHPLYPTSFLVGHRNTDSGPEEVGALIVKGTFHGLASPIPAPNEEQVPVQMSDVPFPVPIPFLVPNGDFEDASMAPWQASSGTLEQVEIDGRRWGRLTSTGSDAMISQKITSSRPLNERDFVLAFEGWVGNLDPDEKIAVGNFRLETENVPPETICDFTAELSGSATAVFSEPDQWTDIGNIDSFVIVLAGTGEPSRPVHFDNVQIHEERVQVQYENDLAVYKPHVDVVVLGASHAPGGSTIGTWHIVLDINGKTLEKEFIASNIDQNHTRTIFGWASTNQQPRLGQAGDEDELKAFDPNERPLPETFQNEFFNGYDRALTGSVPLSFLPDGTSLEFRTERRPTPPGAVDHLFTVALPESRPHVTLTVLDDGDQQDVLVPLVLDTVVIEPDLDRYTVVWRGTELFDAERMIGLRVTGGPE